MLVGSRYSLSKNRSILRRLHVLTSFNPIVDKSEAVPELMQADSSSQGQDTRLEDKTEGGLATADVVLSTLQLEGISFVGMSIQLHHPGSSPEIHVFAPRNAYVEIHTHIHTWMMLANSRHAAPVFAIHLDWKHWQPAAGRHECSHTLVSQ